ncbi:TetR/AcrR family transcriptional regulator [Nocardia sp. NPDC059246]|uniref:TetR/AcrR family transcriptional regulator n=1 Tax=unclassified Nocardia TaxID=2637762 RepID=UPI0036A53ACD
MRDGIALRRSSEEVRERLLQAAREAFADIGYSAKTKDIARQAGVSESLIYTQFGSKSELFRVAVVSTFTDAIEDWVTRWEGTVVEADIAAMADSYVRAVYDVARTHRHLLRELMTLPQHADPTFATLAKEVSRRFANSLGRVQRVVRLGAMARGYPLDDSVSLAVATAMIVSTAVYDDWFLSDEIKGASPDRLMNEIVSLCLYGITGRPATD